MKKIILSAAALLIGAATFAQVSGAPVADQSLVPKNSADAEANAGLSIQNGNDNRVRVRQAGELNTSYTEQDNGTGTGGNLARVMQTGNVNGNQADSGEDNAAEVRQSGTANQSTTVQEGDFNNAYTAQGQNNDASSGNKAKIRQGTGNQAESNYAAIEQDGADNQAQTQQTYDNSDAWTRQTGDENKSMITQNASPEASDGHEASNEQIGNRNESFINQSGAGARNVATARQLGDDNQAKQTQTTIASAGMTGNRGDVTQGVPATFDPLITTLFSDLGAIDANFSPVIGSQFDSDGAKAKQIQNGKEQEAAIRQFGGSVGASNYAEQVQFSGWGNDAAIEQGHHNSGEPSNYAKQYQAGDNNLAQLGQSGSGFKALQDQRGHRNDAKSSQRGESHLLNIHQRGNDNDATSVQAGDANSALIVQKGGQSFVAQQNAGLGTYDLSGGGNQIDALQLGPNGDFGADGIDCDFEDPMNLDMDYTVPSFDLGDVCPGC